VSFTSEVKDELSHITPENALAGKAELSALVHIEGQLSGRYRLEIVTERSPVARIIVKLFHSLYRLKTEVTTRRSVLHKNYSYLITLPAQLGLEEAIRDLGILSSSGLEMGVAERLVARPESLAAYLRGAFLGGGFIANPREDAHFELVCNHQAFANGLAALLSLQDIPARVTQRRASWVVYIKGAEPILEFRALVGAHQAVLAMESMRVTKSIRNDENRIVNAELANQRKSIEASLAQVRDIQLCIDKHGLESFPPALRELAELRLQNPGVSLRELGELANPPLSKSAVYHRVRRIEAIAKKAIG
jgi:DNA-binding protein WhiA